MPEAQSWSMRFATLWLVIITASRVLTAHAAAPVLMAYDSGGGGDPATLDSYPGLNALMCFHWPPKPELIAAAHARDINVIRATGVNTSDIHTAADRAAIVANLTASVVAVGGDGIHIDDESYAGVPSPPPSTAKPAADADGAPPTPPSAADLERLEAMVSRLEKVAEVGEGRV